jgi:hypothetical protein
MKVTSKIYKQFLLHSQINYTCEYLGKHSLFSGDGVERFLKKSKFKPNLLWERAKSQIVQSPNGHLIIDDTVAAHESGRQIEVSRVQWSGAKHAQINGIGIVNLLYYNPDIDEFWLIDLRIYDTQRDGKTKNQHAREMIVSAHMDKQLSYQTVLFDSIYASKEMLLLIGEDLGKYYVTNLTSNRLCNDRNGALLDNGKYMKAISELSWTDEELEQGKVIYLNHFPKKHQTKLYQLARTESRIDNLCTNDPRIETFVDIHKEATQRWKVEQLHREEKQLTGLEKCQCRKQRSQRNHIVLASLVWYDLRDKAKELEQTVYQVKKGLLDDYMISIMQNPMIEVG